MAEFSRDSREKKNLDFNVNVYYIISNDYHSKI